MARALIVRYTDCRRSGALAASTIIRGELHVVHAPITRHLFRTGSLGADLSSAGPNALTIWRKAAITEGIYRLVLEDAFDGEGYRVTVRIGNTQNAH